MQNEVTTTKSNLPTNHITQEDQVLRSDILVPWITVAQGMGEEC